MKSKEEKLIALKILLNVQDLTELAHQSKTFRSNGVVVKKQGEKLHGSIEIETVFVKEVSWLLFQFKYLFQDSKEDFLLLCNSLALKLPSLTEPKEIAEYLIQKSGKLLT